jgi:hypothetical protein
MAKIDWEKEHQRLTKLYARMEDAELEKIGAPPESLTDVARETLRAEMLRRGLKLPESGSPEIAAQKLVIARRYRDLPEAWIAKSILDSASLECFLADDNIVRLDWFYSNLVGGIKIFVREEDAETANRLLAQDVPEKFDLEGVGEYDQPRCPRCQSFDVSLDGLDRQLTYTSLWVGLPIPITNKDWKCHSCKNIWKDDSDPPPGSPAIPEPEQPQ